MFRLTREVRFALNPDGTLPPDGNNGSAGRPGLQGLGYWLALRVTLRGKLDPASQYLRNIADIDREVRTRALPVLQRAVREQRLQPAIVLSLRSALLQVQPGWTLDALELCLSPFLSFSVRSPEIDMIRLSQKFEFSASHRLHNPLLSDADNRALFGKCNNPNGHGHNYELQVNLAGSGDSSPLISVHNLEQLVERHILDSFDHKHLNLDIAEFATLNPSVENIARVIYTRLRTHLEQLSSVVVWETPRTSAEYGGEG